ncbi:MAG: copper resistance protein B [Pseudomonadota bacterium]
MTRLSIAFLATGAVALSALPAQAQHQGHNMPGMSMPMPAKKPTVKKPAPKKPVARASAAKRPALNKPAARKPVAKKPAAKKPLVDPHAGHQMPAAPSAVDPHAGHDMSAMPDTPTPPVDPHAGHDMSAMPAVPAGTDLPAGNAPPPPVPTNHAADAVYGAPAMEMGRHHLNQYHGAQKQYQLMFNIAEAQFGKGPTAFEWDAEGWYGGDISRLLIKSEGEGAFGRSLEKAEFQALYSHAIGPYFNLQGGVRHDVKPDPSRVYATVGFEGLAPGFFDVEGALFLSNKGELMARVEGYYDQRITQRLILQPRAELNFAAQGTREIGVGSGLSDAELGLRLRYDIRREFAPYVGVQYRRAFGETRRFQKEEGESAGGWKLLTGVRIWF